MVTKAKDTVDEKIRIVDTYLFQKWDTSIKRTLQRKHKLALIIEPRCHYRLRPTIVNVLHFLGEDWDLLFVGSNQSVNYVNLILPNLQHFSVTLNVDNLDPHTYSSILMNPHFLSQYQNLFYEDIFVFQTDSFVFKPFPSSVFDQLYIGAPDFCNASPNSAHLIYNGGISFRKMSFMIHCLTHYSIAKLNEIRSKQGFVVSDNHEEDFYYSECLSILLSEKHEKEKKIGDLPISLESLCFGQLERFFDMSSLCSIHSYQRVRNSKSAEFITLSQLSSIEL